MFCDLVDSTGIAAKLDAEEWRDLVGAYLDAALAEVLEMGGKVAKKLGDGLMALFGYPVAQGTMPSVQCGRRSQCSGRWQSRTARTPIPESPRLPRALQSIRAGGCRCGGRYFGDVPNIAARAQALAEPGSLVVTARAQRQVAGLFVTEGVHATLPQPGKLVVRVFPGHSDNRQAWPSSPYAA